MAKNSNADLLSLIVHLGASSLWNDIPGAADNAARLAGRNLFKMAVLRGYCPWQRGETTQDRPVANA